MDKGSTLPCRLVVNRQYRYLTLYHFAVASASFSVFRCFSKPKPSREILASGIPVPAPVCDRYVLGWDTGTLSVTSNGLANNSLTYNTDTVRVLPPIFTACRQMFVGCRALNVNLPWNTAKVVDMSGMVGVPINVQYHSFNLDKFPYANNTSNPMRLRWYSSVVCSSRSL